MTTVFAGTLHLRVAVSYWHQCMVWVVHVASAVVAALLALHRFELVLLLLPIAASSALSWRRAMLRCDSSVLRLRWHGDDEWNWQTRDGRWHTGVRIRTFVFATLLVIVTLRAHDSRWRRTCVVLWRDSLDYDSHRQLRARLTVAGYPDTSVTDA